jgi:hypothetical protein
MQKKVTINNSNQSWNPKKRYKINEVVYYNGAEYQNVTGINSEPGVGLNWIALDNTAGATMDTAGVVKLTSYDADPKVYPQGEMDDLLDKKLNIADVPSNLNLYPTNVASDISGYSKMVISLDDADYNDTAVDISTAEITTTDQLVASLASAEGILKGNPGIINVTTIGNVKRLSGTGTAEFYFKIFKRTSAGVETLIGTSNATMPISNSVYGEFQATAILNNGSFTETDRIVIKYYANRIAGNSNPVYQFQFGGVTPVRTILPVPFGVIPINSGVGIGGTLYSYVAGNGTPTENGAALTAAYTAAKAVSGLTATNRYKILVGTGKYQITGQFPINTEFIDFVSLTGDADVEITNGINVTANNVFLKGLVAGLKSSLQSFQIATNLNLLICENCIGGDDSFGGGISDTASGTFTNCIGGEFSFGSGGTASGTFTNCIGGYGSFGGGGTASGTFTDCQGGAYSFGGGISNTASGTFTNCIGGDNSFGGSGFLSGKLYYCRLTTGTFSTVSSGGRTYYCVDGNGNVNNQ